MTTTERKTVEQQLEELIPDREFIISTNSTGQGWMIYDSLPEGDTIYAQTVRVNSKTVKVERLHDLHKEFGPEWSYNLWHLAVEREAVRVQEEIKTTFPTKRGLEIDPDADYTWYKFPSGNWRGEEDIWDIAMNWAFERLRKRGYDVPESGPWSI